MRATQLSEKSALLFELSEKTQAAVARNINVSRTHLNRFLNGEVEISANKFADILLEFGIDLGEIIDSKVDEYRTAQRKSE